MRVIVFDMGSKKRIGGSASGSKTSKSKKKKSGMHNRPLTTMEKTALLPLGREDYDDSTVNVDTKTSEHEDKPMKSTGSGLSAKSLLKKKHVDRSRILLSSKKRDHLLDNSAKNGSSFGNSELSRSEDADKDEEDNCVIGGENGSYSNTKVQRSGIHKTKKVPKAREDVRRKISTHSLGDLGTASAIVAGSVVMRRSAGSRSAELSRSDEKMHEMDTAESCSSMEGAALSLHAQDLTSNVQGNEDHSMENIIRTQYVTQENRSVHSNHYSDKEDDAPDPDSRTYHRVVMNKAKRTTERERSEIVCVESEIECPEADESYQPPDECPGPDRQSMATSAIATSPFLSKTLQHQQKTLEAKGRLVSPHSSRKKKKEEKDQSMLQRAAAAKTKEEKWLVYVDALTDTFFTSRQARCLESSRVRKGTIAYHGLLINEENCEDMQEMYKLGWQTKASLGQSTATYAQFRIAIGQYCRLAVAAGLVDACSLWKKGEVYKLICSMDAVNAFLNYFQIRSAAGTVMCKANHLNTLARFAEIHFRKSHGNWNMECGAVAAVAEYVRCVSRANKSEARRQAHDRQRAEDRTLTGKYILPNDFERFRAAAKESCEDMMSSCVREIGKNGRCASVLNEGFLQKWGINFLCLLMFHGCGQRPQVFTLLESPQELDIAGLRSQCRRMKCFEIKLSHEKRQRCIDLPHVIFPKVVLKFVKFHIRHILPAIHEKCCIPDDDPKRRFLLLNTRSGELMLSYSVSSTLRRWIKNHDPDFADVSAMSLRASFATIMVQKHRQKKILTHLSEDAFISYLSKLMNTSEEQLKQTYIAVEHQDFTTCAKIVAGSISIDDEEMTDSD